MSLRVGRGLEPEDQSCHMARVQTAWTTVTVIIQASAISQTIKVLILPWTFLLSLDSCCVSEVVCRVIAVAIGR